MSADVLLSLIGVAGTAIAAYADIKTREVPNMLTYSMVASGLLIRFLYAATTQNWAFFLYGILGLAIMSGAGILLYISRQWGGGDAKLLMGLGAVFGSKPAFVPTAVFGFPFLAVLIMNIAIVGALYGVVISAWIARGNWQAFTAKYRELNASPAAKRKKLSALFVGVLLLGAVFLSPSKAVLSLPISLVAILTLIMPYLSLTITAIEKGAMTKKKRPQELTEGDWVEQDVYSGKKLVYKRKPLGIEKRDIALLIRARVREVIVKEGIPFIPPFFIGLVWTIVTGQILFF